MYQAPTTTPATTPQRPARPQFRLGGRLVTQEMFYAYQQAKRAGRRCILVTAGESELSRTTLSAEDCANCGGFGHLALEVIMGGPFKQLPHVKGNSGADEDVVVLLRPAWNNGAWWTVVREMYPCPACSTTREIIL